MSVPTELASNSILFDGAPEKLAPFFRANPQLSEDSLRGLAQTVRAAVWETLFA